MARRRLGSVKLCLLPCWKQEWWNIGLWELFAGQGGVIKMLCWSFIASFSFFNGSCFVSPGTKTVWFPLQTSGFFSLSPSSLALVWYPNKCLLVPLYKQKAAHGVLALGVSRCHWTQQKSAELYLPFPWQRSDLGNSPLPWQWFLFHEICWKT